MPTPEKVESQARFYIRITPVAAWVILIVVLAMGVRFDGVGRWIVTALCCTGAGMVIGFYWGGNFRQFLDRIDR